MASVLWDVKGIQLVDYLPTDQTITRQFYENLLDQLQENIREKSLGLARKRAIFHQDNARPKTSVIAMAKIHELRSKIVAAPALFTSFGTNRLSSLPQAENCPG